MILLISKDDPVQETGTTRQSLPGSHTGHLGRSPAHIRCPDRLDVTVARLQYHHLASTTRTTYNAGWARFKEFCINDHTSPLPTTENSVLRFIAHLFLQNISPATIKVYVASIAKVHAEASLPSPTASASVLRAVDGCRRICPKAVDGRLPITLDIMRRLKDNIRSSALSAYSKLLIWSTFTTAFFAALRVSEFTSQSTRHYDDRRTLSTSDVTIGSESVVISVRRSKTDQFGHGYKITLVSTSRSVCPVTAIQNYAAVRIPTQQSHPFFLQQDGQFVTRTQVDRWLQIFLNGTPGRERYSTHSFRIGAASTAASNGAPDSAIQTIGRWKSSCFTRYVRTAVPTPGLDAYGTNSGLG
ncbi:uncharacterized protein LOC129597431 [Paramacrobiotus metropolitanus]|uniref:uncharacterized protein LOC129597431 n=1 Tax=Paramacrobiotus metropolitanus TaxID=2943436 RepID=UPI002445B88F|nr:uncharacterized protein LOC129597431 [Paramacrobiotus metropolitanus]